MPAVSPQNSGGVILPELGAPKSLQTAAQSSIACFVFGSADAPIGGPTLSRTGTEKEEEPSPIGTASHAHTARKRVNHMGEWRFAHAFDNGDEITTRNVEDRESSAVAAVPGTAKASTALPQVEEGAQSRVRDHATAGIE
jgi:hypothetical protein